MSDLLDLSPPGQLSNDSLAGAKAYFYDAGTTTLRTVYSDSALTVPHPSPLQADADGLFAQVFVSGTAVKVVVTDSADGSLYTLDPAPKIAASGSSAASVSFAPTAEIPSANVQAAIEKVQANIAAPLADFGVGVTGSAGLVANIDATNIASGAYRFDNTTTGTFPTGITASITGIVETWREVAGASIQFLYPETSDRIFFRRYTSAAWQSWREVPAVAKIVIESDGISANNNDTTIPTSAAVDDRIHEVMNITGSAPAYACRAWVNFDGTGTPSIRGSGNVSSITDNGTGDFRLNFTTSMPDTNYAVLGTSSDGYIPWVVDRLTGSCRVQTWFSGYSDRAENHFAIFR